MRRYLLIDGNSLAHAANSGQRLSVGATPTQAIFGTIRSIHNLMQMYGSMTPLVLWDGASWRKIAYPDYKANRDKADTRHEIIQQQAKAELKRQAPVIEKALTLLGIDQIRASNMEADDLAGILVELYTRRGDKIMLVSGDKDWLQLVGENVTWFDPIRDVKVTPATFKDKTGVVTTRQFVELKALMGDTGDNVPGVGGVGEKGGIEFLNTYGTFANFTNQVLLEKTIDIKKLPKKFRALIEDETKIATFQRNIDLMDLSTRMRPDPINLRVTKGEPDRARFEELCRRLAFKSIYSHLDNWLMVFPAFQMEYAA